MYFEWKQNGLKLPVGHIEILTIVMGYVDRASEIRIDGCSIEQELQDIENMIEDLAIKIENGEYHEPVED